MNYLDTKNTCFHCGKGPDPLKDLGFTALSCRHIKCCEDCSYEGEYFDCLGYYYGYCIYCLISCTTKNDEEWDSLGEVTHRLFKKSYGAGVNDAKLGRVCYTNTDDCLNSIQFSGPKGYNQYVIDFYERGFN